LAIAVNIGYTAASIPLALHYLGKEQFGLWALAQQIAGYLMLLDMGVSSAVSRFIADRKDAVNSGSYGSLLLTGAIVFAFQGFLIAVVGVAFSFSAPSLFSIPPHFSSDFTCVLIIITLLSGLSVVFRSLGAPLWAFQRVDVSYGLGSLSLILSFIALWVGFQQGWGIYSFAFAGAPSDLPPTNFSFRAGRLVDDIGLPNGQRQPDYDPQPRSGLKRCFHLCGWDKALNVGSTIHRSNN
jgi:O-antigen/teichoic acid export membrane protein